MAGHEQRPGDYRVICDFSGFQAWASDCVKTHDGYFVLRRFVGEEVRRHPQEAVRTRSERTTVPIPRPEQADVFLSPGDVTAADL